MVKDDKVMLEKYKKRIKDQNNAAKENWDTVSCRLPKGTKDRIRALGLSVNGVINDCVLKFLKEQEQNNAGLVQNEPQATESKESSVNDKSIEPTKNIETGADNDTDKMLKLQEETREIWEMVIEKLKEIDRPLYDCCKRECIYRGNCPELKPCGYSKTDKFKKELVLYQGENK